MKKKITIFLILMVLLLTILSGCSNNDDGPVKNIDLPENGIVTKSELKSIAKNEQVLYIEASSNAVEYQWAVFGTKIDNPRDINFIVEINESEGNEYIVTLAENIEFSPSLTIRLPWNEEIESVTIFDENENEIDNVTVSEFTTYADISFYIAGGNLSYTIKLNYIENNSEETNGQDTGDSESGTNEAKDKNSNISDGTQTGKDKYQTDPVPEGKPLPVEPEDQEVTDKTYKCTFSITCATILNNMDLCDPEKVELVPEDGWILKPTTVTFKEGESVFDVLKSVCKSKGIHMEFEWTPIYNSAYIEGINNLYEFDVGNLSGWMYKVNGWFPNYGCSRYQLSDGDTVVWCYTCDLGQDVGGGYAVGGN